MTEQINQDRRRLLGAAVLTIAAAELAMIGSADAQSQHDQTRSSRGRTRRSAH